MDDDSKKKRQKQETEELAKEINAAEAAEAEAASAILAIIELTGTHTTSTETEIETEVEDTKCMSSKSDIEIDSRKHVSFQDNKTTVDKVEKVEKLDNIENLDKVEKLDKVKDYVKEIEEKEEAQATDKSQQLAKKRKMDANKRQEQIENEAQKESAKRKRSDIENFNLDDIIIEELPDTDDVESIASNVIEESEERQDQPEQRSKDDNLVISENQEIAERFKQIMEMFDNFTKNLESLEMSSMSDDNIALKELSPKSTVLDLDVGDGMARDRDGSENISIREKRNNDYIIDMEDLLRPETEQFELSQLQQSNVSELPKWRQGLQRTPLLSGSLRSCKDIATSTKLESRSATIASVSCQTSLYDQDKFQYDVANSLEGASGPEPSNNCSTLSVVMPPRSYDQKSSDTIHHLDNECRVETYMAVPNTAAAAECKTPQLGQGIGTSISRQNLVKVTESPSMLELPVLTQPYSTERTFHTIHIDTTSSPSSSVMRRPPLGVRCWHVITDMFNAICTCLQVNKDCIFCIGFFIAFVVSASFLTAFFYRTLSMTPQFFHPTPASTLQLTGTAIRDTGFYYY